MNLHFPPPALWQDFQLLTLRLAEQICDEGSVREYGRHGQKQNGVDVYGAMLKGGHIGIQCKEMKPGKSLTKAVMQAEADKALKFKPKLDLFVVATSLPEDTAMHLAATELTDSGVYPFRVSYWSWAHFNDKLNRSNQLIQDSYESYARAFDQDDERRDRQALWDAFNRPVFIDQFEHEHSHGDFVEALGDTVFFLNSGLLRDRISRVPVGATLALNMLPNGKLKALRKRLLNDVSKLRDKALEDKAKGRLDARSAPFYNLKRITILDKLNVGLGPSGHPPITPNYGF
ncbi:hypothetical protein QTI51_22950 [Variovorax sp. J22G73]|uniref:hypothetical protein n=1 Tax=unclassified Variovorax TaxID=663243 RepID=UPI0025765DEB|nr:MULTISPECIES: hypothetical protein [unclassified Variovorax]MDM0007477.1 hypothetical protein [Variovorax sp. J22R203]MDM0100163.1 hypothetical protein [Variovorax sp. J22G73]